MAYAPCSCRDCFELAIADNVEEPALCGECEEAGCAYAGEDCSVPNAYEETQ